MKTFWLPGILFLLLSAGCSNGSEGPQTGAPPEKILSNLGEENRFFSIEKAAHMLIAHDPSLLLVDVRSHEEFDAFSLPDAINIPLEHFASEESRNQLDCERYAILFFSNSSVKAEQAWMLARRMGCDNAYILKGGLKAWAEGIIKASPPPETASAREIELYQLQLAARKYFIGSSKALEPEPYVEPAPAPVKAEKRKRIETTPKAEPKPAAPEEEGC